MTSYWLLAAFVAAVFFFLYFGQCVRWWIFGRGRSGVGLVPLMRGRVRGAHPRALVEARLLARAAGVELSLDAIETQHLAGADVLRTLAAVIAAQRAGVVLDFNEACLVDRQRGNPLDLIHARIREQQRELWAAAEHVEPEQVRSRIGRPGAVAARVGPAGIIVVDDQPLLALSADGILEPGARAKIIDVQGAIALIRALPSTDNVNPIGSSR